MIKKYSFIAVTLAGIVLVAHFASAAISYQGFTFDKKLTTSQGKDYFVDLIAGESMQSANGKYDIGAKLGFYGVTDPNNDGLFTSEIDDKTYVKYKSVGALSYLGQMEVISTILTNVPAQPGRMITYEMRSSGNGLFVDPGNYVVDAVLNNTVVETYTVCLPSFTSTTGNKIGNVVCANQAPTPANTPAPTTPTTPTATTPTTPPPPAGAGTFTFDPIETPSVSCITSSSQCTFTKKLKGNQLGDIAVYINMYPAADFEAGVKKGFSVNGFSYTVKVYPGKTYIAKINLPTSELVQKMNAMQAPDRKYYIAFQDAANVGNQSNMIKYDFGSLIPMSAGQLTNASFELTSLLAPDTTATIKATITGAANVSVTSPLDLYIWPSGGVPKKVGSSTPVTITSAGVPIEMEASGLVVDTSYNYRFVIAQTNEIIYENMFSTGIPSDQALAMVLGVCGTADGTTRATEPSAEGELCGSGNATTVSGIGPWSWSCLGIGGGDDVACSAQSLSSAGGATCGSAKGAVRADAPSAEAELCANGTSSVVTTTAAGWDWTCTLGNDQKPCTATKTSAKPGIDGAGDGSGDGTEATITKKGLIQNPFKELDSFPKIIKAVMNNIILPIAVPFIAVMLIYSGFLFTVAKEKGSVYSLDKAKQTLVYTLIGAVLTLGAFVIANALQSTLNSIVSTRYESNHKL